MDLLPWVIGHNLRVAQEDAADAWATVDRQRKAIYQWEDKVKELERKIMLLEARLDGVTAQRDALTEMHTDSPLLKESDMEYVHSSRRGQKKLVLTLIWERAYDARLESYNLFPRAYRID